MLEQEAERRRRLAMASEHEAAGGILVEPMGKDRRTRQAKSQRVEGGFEIGPAFGAAMHRQARGFVDHQHQPVAMKHAGLDFIRGQLGNLRLFGQDFRSWPETANTRPCGGHWI